MEEITTSTIFTTHILPCCDEKRMCHARGKINSVRTGNSPAALYQRLKLIQNTVRVPASLYTANLTAMPTHQVPFPETQTILNEGSPYIGGGGVNWNQMSDRRIPHKQTVVTADRGKSSTRHTIVRLRPGAGSPGGIGVDIKHNSYDRYLNRTKAKLLKRGPVPKTFGDPTPNNAISSRSFPEEGGKTLKTAIITASNCEQCPPLNNQNITKLYELDCFADVPAYTTITHEQQLTNLHRYKVGDFVWAHKCKRVPKRVRAQVVTVSNDETIYTVKFDDCCTAVKHYADLKPYKSCAPHLFEIGHFKDGQLNVCDRLALETLQNQWNQ